MSIRLLGAGLVGAFVMGTAVTSQMDLANNYQQVDARVTKSKTECYVESGRRKVVERDSNRMAYMPCKDAPAVARQFDHAQSAIHRRTKYEFSYRSPVDGSRQKGKHTDSDAEKNEYRRGRRIKVFAHNEKPGVYRVR